MLSLARNSSRRHALYSEQIRAHYAHPRNVGSIPEPSGKAMVRSPFDSDTVLISLRMEDGLSNT